MKISKEEFKKLFLEKTNKDLAKELGICTKTLTKYAKKLGLKKRKGYSLGNKPKIEIVE